MEWTGARYADMPTVQVTTWIDAPVERVWDLASDIELMPSLSAELQSVEWLGEASCAVVGAQFIGHSSHEALGQWSTTSEVIRCERPNAFSWAVGDLECPTATWRFELAGEDGGTILTEWMQLGPGRSGLSRAIERMPDKEQKIVFVRMREFEERITETLGHLKDLAER